MVKKTYIIPETIVVRLMPTTAMLQASNPNVTLSTDSNNSINAASVDTKGVSDVNVWDEEW